MGYAFCIGHCLCCKRQFNFNPLKVPSQRVNGVLEPVCANCMALINIKRKEKGLKPFPIHADAYEPIREEDL